MTKKKKIYVVMTVITIVITIICAIFIMANQMGLSDSLDFGAGAYYYADIPNFERFTGKDVYSTSIPYWVYLILYLCWGWLMFRLWAFIENKRKKR